MENMLKVGVIASPHGVKEEVKVFPTTDNTRHFKELEKVILDTRKEYIPMEIEHIKFFENVIILKFKGYDNISKTEKYKFRNLLITRDRAVSLASDEYSIMDLIGLAVVSGRGIGLETLRDVLETRANGVCVVTMKNGEELMLPAIGDCILSVDLEQRRMEVHVLEGLMGL